MKFGVPSDEFVNDFSDIEIEYKWFDNADDAIAFAKTDDALPNAVDGIVTIGS